MNIKSIAVKGTIGLAGISGVCVATYEAYKKIKNSSSGEKNEYKPLSSNSEYWETILDNYKAVVKNKEELKLGDFDGNDLEDNSKKAVEILKELCKDALSNQRESAKTNKWCVEPVTVGSFLKKKGFKELNTNAYSSPEEKAKWEAKIRAHKKASETIKKITRLELDGNIDEVTEKNYADIKQTCIYISEIQSYDEKYEEGLEVFEFLCATK